MRFTQNQVVDPGHMYTLPSFDWKDGHQKRQVLTFVKRCDIHNPSRYPGNKGSYPGTTLQMVIRALLDRVQYLQKQKWCIENVMVSFLLMLLLWMLEERAARRHGLMYLHGLHFASYEPVCLKCGHTICRDCGK